MTEINLRQATGADVEAIAALWHAGWPDGHLGNVPDELAEHRQLADFLRLVPARMDTTTVAASGDGIVGFVTVHDDEVEQMYVARSARGSGAAATLLTHAEQTIARQHDRAWLAVVAGNVRARRFYERQGWQDSGPFDYLAEVDGGTFTVPCHRYEKQLTRSPRS
ncbi:MAG TPA: GNAT family N-acetyltransferase [Jiangellaceae bacterium]